MFSSFNTRSTQTLVLSSLTSFCKYRTRLAFCRVLKCLLWICLLLIFVAWLFSEFETSNMRDLSAPIKNTLLLLPKQKIDRYIFQIGFNKCGTTSLYAFMVDSGIPSIHNTPCSFDPKEMIRSPNQIYFNKMMIRNRKMNRPLLSPECSDYFQFYSDFGREVNGQTHTLRLGVLDDKESGNQSSSIQQEQYTSNVTAWYSLLLKEHPQSLYVLNIRSINHWLKSKYLHRAPYQLQYRFNRRRNILNREIDEMAFDHDHLTDVDVLRLLRRSWYLYICNAIDYFGENDIASQLLLFNVESDPVQKLTDFFIRFGIKLNPKYWGQNNKSGARQKEQYITEDDKLQKKRWEDIERKYSEFSVEERDNRSEYQRIDEECRGILGQEKWTTLFISDDELLRLRRRSTTR